MQRITVKIKNEFLEMNFDEIYLQYNKLGKKLAYQYCNKYLEYNDLISISNYSLFKAFNTYDYKRNIDFSTYYTKIIKNDLLMQQRQINKRNRESSLELFYSLDSEFDMLKDFNNSHLDLMIQSLNEKDKELIKLYYFYGYKQWEIAIITGKCRSWTSRKIQNIVKKMGDKYEYR